MLMQKLGYGWALSLMLFVQGPEHRAKGYAFYRPVLGGARPGRLVESGAVAEIESANRTRAQYFFYLVSSREINTNDTAALWMEGKRVAYEFQQVSLPVRQASGMFPGQIDTLIAGNSGYAYQLVVDISRLPLAPVDGKASNIDWYYRKKGKSQRVRFAPWKGLSPLALP